MKYNTAGFKKFCEGELNKKTFLFTHRDDAADVFDSIGVFVSPNSVCLKSSATGASLCIENVVSTEVEEISIYSSRAYKITVNSDSYIRSSSIIIAY